MTLVLTPPSVLQPIFGTQVQFADWVALSNFVAQTAGYATAFQQGVESAQTLFQPLALTADGTDMVVTLGAANEFVLCNGLICGTLAGTNFTVPNNASGITRTDKVWILPSLVQKMTVSREVEDVFGNKTTQDIPYVVSGLIAAYDTGGTNPPGGNYVEFATIAVPNGATAITNGEITQVLPLMNPAGPAGANGYTTTTATFTIPAVASSVTVAVASDAAFPIGAYVVIGDGTHSMIGLVTAEAPTSLTVQCVATSNAGATMGNGAKVGPSGEPGVGTPGTNGSGATLSTAGVVIPTIGSAVNIPVQDPTAFPVGALGLISDGTHAFAFIVTSESGATLTVKNLGLILGAVGNTVASVATVTFSGVTPTFYGAQGGVVTKAVTNNAITSYTIPLNNDYADASYAIVVTQQTGFGTVGAIAIEAVPIDGTSFTLSLANGNNTAGNANFSWIAIHL